VLVAVVASLSYWLGYQHGSSPWPTRLNRVSNLKQVGLAFREDRNTVSRFVPPGGVVTTKTETQGR
jgi:hypothetical protein